MGTDRPGASFETTALSFQRCCSGNLSAVVGQLTQYSAGDKVLYQGLPYQAKWMPNQECSPATESSDPSGSAWKALYRTPGEPAGAPALG